MNNINPQAIFALFMRYRKWVGNLAVIILCYHGFWALFGSGAQFPLGLFFGFLGGVYAFMTATTLWEKFAQIKPE